MKAGFIERSLRKLAFESDYASGAERIGAGKGLLQGVDPRVKVAGLFGLVMVAAASRQLPVIAVLFGAAFILALVSRIPVGRLAVWIWTPVLFFTGTVALPALFITPGRMVAALGPVSISAEGLHSAIMLLSRAETAATLSGLLVLTTPWPAVLRALRTFHLPVVFVVILGMTYRYIFVILQSAFEMMESRRSRSVGPLARAERRRIAASSVGVLLSKSLQLSGDVHLAMQSRGFRGEVRLLEDFHAKASDWVWLGGFAALAAAVVWWQR